MGEQRDDVSRSEKVEPMVTLPGGAALCTRCGSFGDVAGVGPLSCLQCDGGEARTGQGRPIPLAE